MNRLPQEILSEIIGCFQEQEVDKPALATISRQWHAAIERHLFRTLRVRSTDAERFQKIVRHGRRRLVERIDYVVELPEYSEEDRCKFERDDARQANDEAFTAAIHRLFRILASWNTRVDGHVDLRLADVYSTSDHTDLRRSSPSLRRGHLVYARDEAHGNRIADLWNWRHRYSFLRLLRASDLPAVPVIRSFVVCLLTRNICSRVPVEMAARMPSLRSGDWKLSDWQMPYTALREAQRCDFAQALVDAAVKVGTQLPALESLSFVMSPVGAWAPNFATGNLNAQDTSTSTSDVLSDAIRTYTASISTLKELHITGAIDGSLFWLGPAQPLPEPYWQKLERLHVEFSTTRPCGGSYFRFRDPRKAVGGSPKMETPPGYGDSEEDAKAALRFSEWKHVQYLNVSYDPVPDDESLMPLMEAFGRACLQIPMLKLAELSTLIPTSKGAISKFGMAKWGVWYLGPGTPSYLSTEGISQRRLIWAVMGWRPSADLRNLLREIGSETWGHEMVEKFVQSPETPGIPMDVGMV